MRRAAMLLALVYPLSSVWTVGPACAGIQEMLNATAWDLEYEVTFKAAAANRTANAEGTFFDTVSLESHFATTLPLNMRNSGANLAMLKLAMTMPQGTTPTAAQQQELMNLVMRTDDLANWMYAPSGAMEEYSESPADDAADEAAARLTFSRVSTGTGLTDDLGNKFDRVQHITRRGAGQTTTATQLVFEIDAPAKRYLLTLTHFYIDHSGTLSKFVSITTTKYHSGEIYADTSSRDESLQFPMTIEIDDPSVLLGEILCFDGQIDPASAVISGERTVNAHFLDHAWSIPGTLSVRYKLTPK